MNDKQKTVITALAAAALLVLMILWMAGSFEVKIEPATLPTGQAYHGPTLTVTQKTVPLYEDVAGTLQSELTSFVSAQIMARVKQVHVHAGDNVNQGDVLIELDNADLQAKLAQVREELNSLRARLVQAQQHYERSQKLFAKESVTLDTLESATAEYQSLRAQRSAARERLAEAENALGYSRIRATFSGKVVDHFIENGDMANPGMRLLSVFDPHNLRVVAYARESLVLKLHPGLSLQAFIDALNRDMNVVIDEIVPAAEPGSRSFLFKAKIDYESHLLPGMFVRIRIPLGTEQQLLIPIRYVKQVGQLDVVWLLHNGVVERRFLRLGKKSNGQVMVISGLQSGDRLVAPEDI